MLSNWFCTSTLTFPFNLLRVPFLIPILSPEAQNNTRSGTLILSPPHSKVTTGLRAGCSGLLEFGILQGQKFYNLSGLPVPSFFFSRPHKPRGALFSSLLHRKRTFTMLSYLPQFLALIPTVSMKTQQCRWIRKTQWDHTQEILMGTLGPLTHPEHSSTCIWNTLV